MSAARIYRLLLSGVRWHESHICAATRTSDKVVYIPSVCAVYSRFWGLVYAVTDTAADNSRQTKFTGAPVEKAAKPLSENPARLFGWTDRGRIAVGARADLVLMDDSYDVVRTIVGGRTVFERS